MAAVHIDACVKAILCGLDRAVVVALSSIIDAQVTALQAELTSVQASLALINVAVTPFQAAQAAAQALIDEAHSVVDLVPVNAMAGCADLGVTMADIDSAIDVPLIAVKTFVARANRFLSFQDQLQAAEARIQTAINFLGGISGVIADALTPGACT